MNTRLLLRAAAVATLLTTIGHLTGSPHLLGSLWAPTNAQQASDVVGAMQAYRFEAIPNRGLGTGRDSPRRVL